MLVKSTAATSTTPIPSFKHHELHETSGLQAIPSLRLFKQTTYKRTNKQTPFNTSMKINQYKNPTKKNIPIEENISIKNP